MNEPWIVGSLLVVLIIGALALLLRGSTGTWPLPTIVGAILVVGALVFLGMAYMSSTMPKNVVGQAQQQQRYARSEDRNRYLFFVNASREEGWVHSPMEVDVDVPLDGIPRPIGIDTVYLGGSRIYYFCPEYWSGGEVKLFTKGDGGSWIHLGHEQTLDLYNTGSVLGGSAILVKGEKTRHYQGTSSRVHVETYPLEGYHRIATTKVCDPGTPYDWGPVQMGVREDAPSWELYVGFADEHGVPLTSSVMHQKPGEIMLGVMEEGKLRPVFDEVVSSKAAKMYGMNIVPKGEKNPMLRIRTPNLPKGKVKVTVVLNIKAT